MNTQNETRSAQMFVDFLCKLEGWKTRCKNLHWAAPNKDIHEYLDDFLEILDDYQDALAEDIMGVLGSRLNPNSINGTTCRANNALEFLDQVNTDTIAFYEKISDDTNYVGIKSETETFIHNIKKYNYLFNLCDI